MNFWHKHRVPWKQIALFITDCKCKFSAKANPHLSLAAWLNVNSAASYSNKRSTSEQLNVFTPSP